MNIRDVKPISQLAVRDGVRCLLYGIAGSGKTPTACTSPSPFILATEGGLLSVRHLDTPAVLFSTMAEISDCINWFCDSKESCQFKTLVIDSISALADISLKENQKKYRNGQQAYGEMAKEVMNLIGRVNSLKGRDILMCCKEFAKEEISLLSEGGKLIEKISYKHDLALPGNVLKCEIPYLYDEILFLDKIKIQGVTNPVRVIRTNGDENFHARDRSNNLDEIEYPDTPDGFPNMTRIFQKCMISKKLNLK
jgi:hypothetical protein